MLPLSTRPVGDGNKRAARFGEFARVVQDGHRAAGQRHPVLQLRLHTDRRRGPSSRGIVDLVPSRAADLGGAAGGEHQELGGERGGPVRSRSADAPGCFTLGGPDR